MFITFALYLLPLHRNHYIVPNLRLKYKPFIGAKVQKKDYIE